MDRFAQVIQRSTLAMLSQAITDYVRKGWELSGSPIIVGEQIVQLIVSPDAGVIIDPAAEYRVIVDDPMFPLVLQSSTHMGNGWSLYGTPIAFSRNVVQAMIYGGVIIHEDKNEGTPEPVGQGLGGFFNYQNTGAVQTLVANTWTTLQNNALGSFTELSFAPDGVSSMLDSTTGRIKLDGLKVGDQVNIRQMISSMGYVNNMPVTFRNYAGQTGQQYAIPFGSTVLMNTGAGVVIGPYAVESRMYIRDENTRLGGILPQIMTSGTSEITCHETYISVIR